MKEIRWIDDLRFWQKSLLLILLPLFFDLGFLWIIASSTNESDRLMKEILVARENIANADALQKSLYKAITFYMDSVYAPNKELYFRYIQKAFEESENSQNRLKKQNSGTELENMYIELISIAEEISATLKEYIKNRQGLGSIVSSAQFLKDEPEKLTRLTIKLDRLQEVQANKAMTKHELLSYQISTYLNLGLFLNGSILMLLFFLFSRSTSTRLNALLRKLEDFPNLDTMARAISGNDEVGKLDRTFRKMALDLSLLRRKETAILDNSLAMLCRVDLSGKICESSPASERLLSYSTEELKGKNFSIISEHESEDTILEKLSAARHSPDSETSIQLRLRKKDGSILECSCGIRWSAQDSSYFCIITDTSTRAKLEKQISSNERKARFLIEHMPVGLLICNRSREIKVANEKLLSMLHVQKENIKSLEHYFHPDCRKDLDELLRRASPEQYSRDRKNMLRADQTIFPAELSARRLEEDEILVVVRDISSRVNIERARQRFREMISERVEYEIASVTGCVLKLAKTESRFSDQGKKYLDKVLTALARTETLLKEMKSIEALSKIGSQINKTITQASSILTKSFLAVEAYAQEKGVSLELISTDDANLYCDEEQIIRVLVNFLSNAVKFSAAGSRVILEGDKHADAFRFAVRDFGRGIPEDKLNSIFAKFEQVEDSDSSIKGGAGLGLAICRSIVEAHDSEICVESKEGKGSLFAFSLALEQVPS